MVTIVGTLTKGISSRNTTPKHKETVSANPGPVVESTPADPQNAATAETPNSNSTQPALPPAKSANTKSQNVVSRFASKFRLPPTSKSFRPPPMSEPITAQGRREAALRARGLLPQKDLSEQEREYDLLVSGPAVASSDGEQSPIQSAADVIKRQWEEKNGLSTTTKSPRASPPPPLDLTLPTSPCDPCQVPLPPSPTLFGAAQTSPVPQISVDVSLDDACSVPLPPSPRAGSIRSIRSSISLESAAKPVEITTPHTAVSSATITPLPSAIVIPRADDLLPPSPLSALESESVAGASIATPSLTAESMSRSISSTSANSEPATDLAAVPPVEGLRIQTSLSPAVPVIVESPIEGSPLASVPEVQPAPEPTSAKTEGDATQPSTDRALPVRRATESAATQSPRKGRKLSMRNIQRSVVGSLYRKPRNPGLDTSNLPPSPALPSSPTRSPTAVSPRVACSPAIHTGGTILMEASRIEDEESRRLCEMAFLT